MRVACDDYIAKVPGARIRETEVRRVSIMLQRFCVESTATCNTENVVQNDEWSSSADVRSSWYTLTAGERARSTLV